MKQTTVSTGARRGGSADPGLTPQRRKIIQVIEDSNVPIDDIAGTARASCALLTMQVPLLLASET